MSDLPEFKRLVCQLIGDGDLPDALQKLTSLLSNDTEKSIQAFHLKSRLSLLNREIDDGQLSHDERKRTFAELSKSLLSLVDRLELADFEAKPATNSTTSTNSPNSTRELPAIPDLSGVSYDHCLRPEFTKLLARTLFEKRQSVNLVAPPETGSNRLVIDLENCAVPDTLFLHVNMKNYVASHQGMLDDIASQAGLAAGSESRLAPLLEAIGRQKGCRLVLNFRNFERVLDNRGDDLDPLFNTDFINVLNALRNRPDLRLIYKTEKPHTQCAFRGRSSWLTLEQLTVRDLTDKQLAAEVARKMPELSEAIQAMLVDVLYTEEKPYSILFKLHEALPGMENPTRVDVRDLVKKIKKEAYGNWN